jgi:transcriptional regulator with GAF, ATPase, and Fis domain
MAVRSVVLASADGDLRQKLAAGLSGMRWTVYEALGGADAMAQVEQGRPEALLLDSWLPDLEVSEFAVQMRALYPAMDILRLDALLGRETADVRSPRRNELLHALRLAQERESSDSVPEPAPEKAVLLQAPRAAAPEILPELIGESPAMLELARLIRLVAPRNASVLIEGETGTGKEVVARAVHRLSARASRSLTVLNCAAIPESLLEAELFGHTRGAFTGAVQSRTGRIEAAHGGTLFLDEIGEMPLALQAKMLRFLECGELQKVGENETLRVDVRVIAATHQHLEERAAAGTFRLDLYHRLAVFPLFVPPLRERLEDLPLLVEYMLEEMGREMPIKRLSETAMRKLAAYPWPGNVRELRHVLERGAILAGDSPEIGEAHLRWPTWQPG